MKMRQRGTNRICNGTMQTLVLTLAACLLAIQGHVQAGERFDLLPRKVRWQTYPSDVRHVVIDRTGRPWFSAEGSATLNQVKSQVEASYKLKAPWVRGAQMHHSGGGLILHFDRAERIWLLPASTSKLLLGYDPHKTRWIERSVMPESKRGGYNERDPQSPALVFTETVYESSSGRLYFGDRIGVHVLSGDVWSYKHLYRRNIDEGRYASDIKSFNATMFTEDQRGRVYVWSRWGAYGWSGTLGYFVHDGQSWRQVTCDNDGRKLEQIAAIVPLAGGRTLVFPESGTARDVWKMPPPKDAARGVEDDVRQLGAAKFREREAAQSRLAQRGPHILPVLREILPSQADPEVVFRVRDLIQRLESKQSSETFVDGHAIHTGRYFGQDGAGHVLFWANVVVEPGGTAEVREKLWLVDDQGRISRAPLSLGDWHPGNSSTFVDSKGRAWIALYRKGCVIWDGQQTIPVTDETQTNFHKILGEDGHGRVFITDGRTVAAVDPDRADDPRRSPGEPPQVDTASPE